MKKILIVCMGLLMISVFGYAATYTLRLSSPTVSENAGTATVTVQIDPALPNGTNIDMTWGTQNTTPVSATAGSDYTTSNGSKTNMTSGGATFTIPILDDLISELTESFQVNILTASVNGSDSVTIDNTGGLVTILDNDTAALPTLSINNITVDENISTGLAVFTVTLSATSAQNVTFNYTTADGNATQGSDYTLTTGTKTITAGSSSVTISVPIINDTMAGEAGEYFNVTLSNPTNATLGSWLGKATIIDDDTGFTLGINDAAIAEGDVNITAHVNLILSAAAPAGGVIVTYHTVSATATAPSDYAAISSGSITIPAGATTYAIPITITGDTIAESVEDFNIIIDTTTASSPVTIADAIGKVTIFDNDSVTGGCSSYVGLMSINEYQNNPHYFDALGNKIVGDYVEIKYIDFLVKQYINNAWSLSVYTTSGTQTLTWDQKDSACLDPRYAVFQFSNSVMGAQGYVVLKDANGNEVDVLNIDNSNHYFQNCQAFVYDTTFGSSAQNKDLFRMPDGTGNWFDTGAGANSVGSRCISLGGGGGNELTYTQFDAVDPDVILPTNITSNTQLILKTKIVNNLSDIKIISIDINNSIANDPLIPITGTIKAYVVDGNSLDLISGFPTYTVFFNNSSYVTLSGPTTAFSKAYKNARFKFEYCENALGVLSNWDTCYGATPVASAQRVSHSRDVFAIRPNDFNTSLTAGQVFIAKQSANITIKADDINGTASLNYNETENTSFKADANISDSTKTCAQPSISFIPSIAFVNGNATGNYSFGNVGDFNVSIHEISGAEFAHIDFDDTPDSSRFITPFTQQIIIKPANFAVDGNLTNGSNGFTYLSNFQDYNTTASRNISAGLDLNITARAFDNNVTSNYTGTCYAKDGNISVDINTFAMTPTGNVTKMLWYEKNHDTNGSMAIPVNNFVMPILHTAFDAAGANGTARVKYLLNFDRNQTKTVNPRSMVVTNVTATDADAVTGAKVPTINSAYYVYGRVNPRDIRVFGANTPFTANAWYEDYNTSTIGSTGLPVSRNDGMWYTNTLHSDASDGDSNVTVVITGTNPTNATAANGIETYSFGNSYGLGGYKAHILTAPWLWYGTAALPYLNPANPANLDCLTHPCFNINIVPPVGATGSAKSTNTATKASKKSDSSGWRSTKDYAPAIR